MFLVIQSKSKKPKRSISLSEKASLIKTIQEGEKEGKSLSKVATENGFLRHTCLTIWRNREKILKSFSENPETTSTVYPLSRVKHLNFT